MYKLCNVGLIYMYVALFWKHAFWSGIKTEFAETPSVAEIDRWPFLLTDKISDFPLFLAPSGAIYVA